MPDAIDVLTGDEEPTRASPEEPDTTEEWTGHPMDKPGTYVCDAMVDGEICGKTFTTRRRLAGHTTQVHRGRTGQNGRRKSGQQEKPKEPPKPKLPPPPVEPAGVRGEMYGASLIGAATIVYLAAGNRFDDYDLSVVTKAAPGWGTALDAVGERHERVRAAADAILGGGSGIIYVQLILMTGAMVMPILAHHGVIPPEVGERFADLIGVMVSPSAPQQGGDGQAPPASYPPSPGEPPTDTRPSPDPEHWTIEEWKGFLFSPSGQRVMSDVMKDMGIAIPAPPTVVDIPDFSVTMRGDNGAAGTSPDTQDTTEEPVPEKT